MIRLLLLSILAALLPTAVHGMPLSLPGKAFVEKYCVTCHGPENAKGELNLVPFSQAEAIIRDAKVWETVIRQVRDREMPPKNKPQPGDEERAQFLAAVEGALANPDATVIAKIPVGKPMKRTNTR